METTVLTAIATLFYILSGGLLTARLFKNRLEKAQRLLKSKNSILFLGLIAVLLHGMVLFDALFGASGLNIGFYHALSLVFWLMALMILLSAYTSPVESLGIAILPMAALSLVLEISFPVEHTLVKTQAMELKIHILMSILAYSLLTIAAIQAVILYIQDSHLRNRKPGGFIRALPPLETMENLLFQMLWLGFFLHSISLATGVLYLEDMFAQHQAHKTILSIAAWFVFATLLWGRWRFGWRGNTAVRWTLGGAFTLGLAYFGSKWVLEIILGR